jgi:hypothetical protein
LLALVGCSDDKASDPSYYLRGRVYDGASQEALTGVELTLLSGTSTKHTKVDKEGNFKLGPITPETGYRISAKGDGLSPFEFTGVGLAAIEGDDDRTLITDIPLYQGEEATPPINMLLADQGVAKLLASARFVPMAAGTDPGVTEADEAWSDSEGVSGHTCQSLLSTLPNDSFVGVASYRATFIDGKSEIPEGALVYGVTYKVTVDAGPAYEPVQFAITPVKKTDIQIALRRASSLDDNSNNDTEGKLPTGTQQYFTGRIYDGVSQKRVTDYAMRLEYFDRVIAASVSADGRYVVGPLLPNADYSIVIEADGYRSFLSHNAKIAAVPCTSTTTGGTGTGTGTTTCSVTNNVTSFYYDAYLYPESVHSPATLARFRVRNDTALPSGTVRFSPRSGSSLFDEASETPAGVNGQVWGNDEDLQQRTVVKTFTNGEVQIAEGELTLGVSYEVSVFGVSNYALLEGASFKAGFETNPTFTLDFVTEAPLQVVGWSTQFDELSPDGRVEIRFNQPIARWPLTAESSVVRQLNDGFRIISPDKDADAQTNVLVDAATLVAPVSPTYRGVSFEISGDRLIFTWARATGVFSKVDVDDLITHVQYRALDQVQLYSAALPNSTPVALSTLLPGGILQVQIAAP